MPNPSHNIANWIANHAARDGSRLAVADDERRLSYADLESRIARLANWLRRAGIGAGDRIGVLLGNRSAALEPRAFKAAPIRSRICARAGRVSKLMSAVPLAIG